MRFSIWLVVASAGGIAACGSETVSFPTVDQLADQPAPDPFVTFDGRAIETVEEWNQIRKPELFALFEHYMYGTPPPAPAAVTSTLIAGSETLGGAAIRYREIELRFDDAPPIHLAVFLPAATTGPVPVLLALNPCGNHSLSMATEIRRSTSYADPKCDEDGVIRGQQAESWPIDAIVARGYALATFHESDVVPDDAVDPVTRGVLDTYEIRHAAGADWGVIGAWAFGLSRAVDHLATDPEIDATRIITTGHSRRGKAALLAAAYDERVAATIPHQSGTAGATLTRADLGESVAFITLVFPHWFAPNFETFADLEDRLPIDQHLLIGMVAPRAVLVTNAADDTHADPPGALEAVTLADPIYKFLGSAGATFGTDGIPAFDADLSWYVRPGDHSLLASDWTVFMDYADRL